MRKVIKSKKIGKHRVDMIYDGFHYIVRVRGTHYATFFEVSEKTLAMDLYKGLKTAMDINHFLEGFPTLMRQMR